MQLTNEQIKIFAIKLAKCESEEEVVNLLTDYGFWNDATCWRYFGDLENNYSSIGNQQASSDAALVEKIINSIDATIMGDLLSRGIDPKSEEAPRSIPEYLKDYKKIPEGKLSLLDPATRRKMSEDILLVSTQNTTSKNPNYCIIDNGEGQTANSLPHTILSLQASNKLKVGAVQGKFNMGGTGVMMFSGQQKFQIIITRKRQDIPVSLRGIDDSFDKWAVTIVRREEPTGTMKSSCFKYLAPEGNILSFTANSLPLKPAYSSTEAIPYKEEMIEGTFIKVFDYHIKGQANSVSTTNLHDRLSLLIPGIALPIKIVECRKTKAKRNKTLYGLTARLEENKQDALELTPIGSSADFHGELLPITTYIFKKGRGDSFKKNEGVLYVLNGQCQGVEKKSFFEKLKLSYISDSILIIVDCSHLSPKTCEELFLNSRDRLKKGQTRDDILKLIEEEVKGQSILKELNAKRRSEELSDKLNNSKMVSNIVGDVLSKSKILNNLLLQGKDLPAPRDTQHPGEEVELPPTREFPTLFTLRKKNRKVAEIDRKIKIELDTDAPNDYFTRDKMSGTYSLECSTGVLTDYSLKVINGIGYLNIYIDPHLFNVGDEVFFRLIISDDSRVLPFVIEFSLTIVEKTKDSPPGEPSPSKPRNKQEKSLPPIQEVRKEDWNLYGMNEFSAILVKESDQDGVYDFFCNLDNKYLSIERQNPKSNIPYLEGIFSTALIVASMSVISHYQKIEQPSCEDESDLDLKELVKEVSSSLAPTIIPIITELSKVKEFEKE